MAYGYNTAVRHTGYDGSSYQYDVTSSMAGNMYSGFGGGGGVSDVFMTSGQGSEVNKRRFEEDPYMRSCKRANKEQFFFDATFSNIG